MLSILGGGKNSLCLLSRFLSSWNQRERCLNRFSYQRNRPRSSGLIGYIFRSHDLDFDPLGNSGIILLIWVLAPTTPPTHCSNPSKWLYLSEPVCLSGPLGKFNLAMPFSSTTNSAKKCSLSTSYMSDTLLDTGAQQVPAWWGLYILAPVSCDHESLWKRWARGSIR